MRSSDERAVTQAETKQWRAPYRACFRAGAPYVVVMDASGSQHTAATCRADDGTGNVCLTALRTTTALATASRAPPSLAAHAGA